MTAEAVLEVIDALSAAGLRASGSGRQVGLEGEAFDHPAGSLEAVGVIGGREVGCGTPELQLAFHRHDVPREHDRRDMAALAAAFGIELPEAYRAT